MDAASTIFDAELVRRYDLAAPRYTSYPAAPHFRQGFPEALYREQAALGNGDPIPRPLAIYVHVPFCLSPCLYCGCHRVIVHPRLARERGAAYLERLRAELALQAALFDPGRELLQVHLGGGTPSVLGDDMLEALVEALDRRFRIDWEGEREFAIELDPRTVDPDRIARLAAIGFNRISLGVQDLDPEVQRAVNRVQSEAHIAELVAAARAAGFLSVNLDLIYGLPRQSPRSFARTLERILALAPDRLAIYSYAHLPERFPAQRRIDARALPSAEDRLAMLGLAVERLTAAGYRHIGMDHFARPSDELAKAQAAGRLHRNFNGYSTHPECERIGVGVSSIGLVGDAYVQNSRALADYERAIDAGRLAIERGWLMSPDDRLRAAVIQAIMCRDRVLFAEIEARFEIDFARHFAAELDRLRPLEEDGLLRIAEDGLEILPRGRLLRRAIAMHFDAYLGGRNAGSGERYSRIV